jgi:hypothetical protein
MVACFTLFNVGTHGSHCRYFVSLFMVLLLTIIIFIDKPKEKKKDSFAEKFATQVIKNLQVEVRNIHVRFEDKYTNPKQPFSIGVSLKELLFRVSLQC